MRVLSLFSGVGGFDMGLEASGMTTVFQCEIDKHARAVLDLHWPHVPKWDDVSTLTGAYIIEQTGGVDLVAWGSPCQDLSVAGKRNGLAGERSGLFHQGIRIIKELRELSNGRYPTFSIWENVVGALSSNGGADFGEVLFEMDEAGACFSEWTVLDAQYFGVPQRRRRVFVTSCFDPATSERCQSPLFPVAESLPGHLAKGSKARKGTAEQTEDGVGAGGGTGLGYVDDDGILKGTVVSKWAKGSGGPAGDEAYNLVVETTTFAKSRRAQSVNDHETWVESDVTPTLNAFDIGDTRTTTAVAYSIREDAGANTFSATEVETARALQSLQPSVQSHHAQTFITQPADPLVFENSYRDGIRISGTGMTQTLSAKMGTGGNNTPMVAQENEPELVVRRLTPLECERLMGWPDNHTATGTNGPVSDSNRYKMCGNGVASPVAAWIARHLPRLDA